MHDIFEPTRPAALSRDQNINTILPHHAILLMAMPNYDYSHTIVHDDIEQLAIWKLRTQLIM